MRASREFAIFVTTLVGMILLIANLFALAVYQIPTGFLGIGMLLVAILFRLTNGPDRGN